MRKILTILLACIAFSTIAQRKAGTWQSYLSYSNANKVAISSDKVFCATEGGLFYQDNQDNSIQKLEDLSDFGIKTIQYSPKHAMLLIAYKNSNIDFVLKNGGVINLPYIKNKISSRDKTIQNITIIDDLAYLSCSFGIVTINLVKNEIADTYIVSENTSTTVYDVAKYGNNLYAATSEGLLKADIQNSNLLNFNSWQHVAELPVAAYNFAETHENSLIVNKKVSTSESTVYAFNGTNWNILRGSFWSANDIHSENGFLTLTGKSDIFVYDKNNQLIKQIKHNYTIKEEKVKLNARNAVVDTNNILWIADYTNGLIRSEAEKFGSIYPGGPISNSVFHVNAEGNQLIIAPGTRTDSWNNTFTRPYLSIRKNDEWTVIDKQDNPKMVDFWDITSTIIDPTNPNHFYAASWGGGLLEFLNGKLVKRYNNHNSPLQTAVPDKPNEPFVRIGGMTFDQANNLWLSVSGVENKVVQLTPSGEWRGFKLSKLPTEENVGDIIVTKSGDKWILAPRGNDAYVVNKNGEQSKQLLVTTYFNNGKVEKINRMNDVYSIAEDLDGNIWIGSSKGVAVYSNPQDIWKNERLYAYEPSLDLNDNLYHPILSNETVSAIAINGANQKWLGTNNSGVFLMSEDGTKELLHFDTDNSPLFSNKIRNISINQTTGEVFIATAMGLISYQGDAIKGKDSYNDVYAYPNPVRENYHGNVTVTGLKANTDVKITDITGNLVFHGKSEGGNAIWNGKNLNGNRVHTGVYLVLCNDEKGEESCITKILFIH